MLANVESYAVTIDMGIPAAMRSAIMGTVNFFFGVALILAPFTR
jgi:hypothetical protein